MGIKWEQPPAEAFIATNTKGGYTEFALALRKRPGAWAKVDRAFASPESAKNMASNVRRGGVKSMPKGEYEAVCHDTTVWVRYVEPEEAEEGTEPKVDPEPEDDGSTEQTARGYAGRVRAWAKLKGIPISDHGRINEHIVRQYEKETGDRRPA